MKQMKNSSKEIEYHSDKKRAARWKNRRNRKALLSVSVIIIAIVVIVICFSKKTDNNELIGKWSYNQYTAYEFSVNGHGYLCVDDVRYEYKYAISQQTLKLDFVEDIVKDCEYTFAIEGNLLTLIGGEGTDQGTYTLTRQ